MRNTHGTMLSAPAAVCAACAVWAVFIPDTQGTAIRQGVLYTPQGQDSPNASRVLLVAAASAPEQRESEDEPKSLEQHDDDEEKARQKHAEDESKSLQQHADDEDKARKHADEEYKPQRHAADESKVQEHAEDGDKAQQHTDDEEAAHDQGDVHDEEGDAHEHEGARLEQDAHDKDGEEEQLREHDTHEDAVEDEAAAEDDADKEALEDGGDDARKEPRVTEEPAEDDGDGGDLGDLGSALGAGLQGPESLTWPTGWLWDSGPGPARLQEPGQHSVPAVFGVGRDYRHLGMRAAFVPLPLPHDRAARNRRAARVARDAGDDFDDGLFRDSGFDALEEAGNQDFHEVASKGQDGHEDHKHSSEEKGGKWEDSADQGEDKGGKHAESEGQWGDGHHHADKHDTSAGKKGYSDKFNFDKTKKHRSFYKNGQKKGSFKEWGHDDSFFFDNEAGDEAGKFKKSGKKEKHSGHKGKSQHQHADEGGDEWGGQKGFDNHYKDEKRYDLKDRHHSSDGYGYGSQDGHAEHYKLTPGFYSWG